MKHIKLILSVTILLTLCINAYSFPDSTASWTDDIAHCYSDWDHALYQYEVNGNTSINSKQYYKIYASGNRDIYDTGYAGAIRSDSSFVYIVLKDSTSEFILYDFSLEKGDVFYSHFFSRNVPVDSVDSINFAGEKRKRIIFNDRNYGGGIGDYWIEGIGSIAGVMKPARMITFVDIDIFCGAYGRLACFKINDSLLYLNDDFLSCNTINPDSIISGHKKTPVQNNNDKFYSLLNNPDKISIQIETETEGSITMYNIFGKQMANFAFHPYETIEIKKSHYSDGIYILEIAALKSKQTEKVIFK